MIGRRERAKQEGDLKKREMAERHYKREKIRGISLEIEEDMVRQEL